MNKYSYKGQIITASSKQEAIAQIVKSGAIGDFFKRMLHQETYLGQYLEKNKNKYDVCTRNIASLIMRFIDYDKARKDLNDKNFVINFLATADKASGIIKDVAEKTSSNDGKALIDFEYVVSKQLHRVYDWVDNNTNRAMDSNLTSNDCKNFAKNALKEYGKNDGTTAKASTNEEAIAKHKVVAKINVGVTEYVDGIYKVLSKQLKANKVTLKKKRDSIIVSTPFGKIYIEVFREDYSDDGRIIAGAFWSEIYDTGSDVAYYAESGITASLAGKSFKKMIEDVLAWKELSLKVEKEYDNR